MEVQHERSWIKRGWWNVKKCVALGPQMEGIDAGLGAAGNEFGRASAEPNRGLGPRTGGQESGQEDSTSRHLWFQTFGDPECGRAYGEQPSSIQILNRPSRAGTYRYLRIALRVAARHRGPREGIASRPRVKIASTPAFPDCTIARE